MGACKRTQGTQAGERGQTVAEFALVLVILMMIVLGIVDLSQAVYARNMVASAAREGARWAITHPGDEQGTKDHAKALVVGLDRNRLDVTTSCPDAQHVQVDVTYRYQPIAMLISQYTGAGLVLHGRSIMRREK